MRLSTKIAKQRAEDLETLNESRIRDMKKVLEDPNAPDDVKEKIRRVLKAVKKAANDTIKKCKQETKNGEKKE